MSPKHILVLLLALVLAANSLARSPVLDDETSKPLDSYPHSHKKHPPEEDNSQVNSYQPRRPPHGPPHNPKTEELSQQEKENSQVNSYPNKRHKRHHPPNAKEDNLPPAHGHPHVAQEDQKTEQEDSVQRRHRPPHRPPPIPPTAN